MMELVNLDLRKISGLKPIDRFHESYVPVPESGCWIWLGKTGSRDYGKIYVNGRYVGAHRFSYEHYNGPLQGSDVVMHVCDTPLCVNPNHLRRGSQGDNVRDCAKKGRMYRPDTSGEKNGRYVHGLRIRDVVLLPPEDNG